MKKRLLFDISQLMGLLVFLLILDDCRMEDQWDKKVMNKRLKFVVTYSSYSYLIAVDQGNWDNKVVN